MTVEVVPAPIVILEISDALVQPDENVTVTWSSEYADSCRASGNGWSGARDTSGTESVSFPRAGVRSFKLRCSGAGGDTEASADLAVFPVPQILSFTADPLLIAVGQSARLRWQVQDAKSCAASGDWDTTPNARSGSFTTPALTQRTNIFTLTCQSEGGEVSETVTVLAEGAPELTLSVDRSLVTQGESITLEWASRDAESCVASGAWGGERALSGNETIREMKAGQYQFTLRCANAVGSEQKTALVEVETSRFSVSATQLSFGDVGANKTQVQEFKVVNPGRVPLVYRGGRFTGSAADQFSSESNCPEALLPGAECAVSVTYQPTRSGKAIATLEIQTNALELIRLELTGNGAFRRLNVIRVGDGVGSIKSEPTGVECGSVCSANFDLGVKVTLTATPDEKSVFEGWDGACQGAGTCIVAISDELSIRAKFVKRLAKVIVKKSGAGDGLIRSYVDVPLTSADVVDPTTQVFWPVNGHIYEVVTGPNNVSGQFPLMSWSQAVDQSGVRTLAGVKGHLVTISSTDELAFIKNQLLTPQNTSRDWLAIGARKIEGVWRWVVGPETGQKLPFTPATGQTGGTGDFGRISFYGALIDGVPDGIWSGTDTTFRGYIVEYERTPDTPTGLDCGAICELDFAVGSTVTLTAISDERSVFEGWSGACTGTADCTIPIAETTSVTAAFALRSHALSYRKLGGGNGRVTSSPSGIDCTTNCAGSFSHGTVVSLTLIPSPDSTFVGWGGACTGTGGCTVTMDQAKGVTATFALKTFALTVTKSGAGSGAVTSSPSGIACGQSCSASFSSGTSVTLNATAANDSTFAGWSGACTGTGACTVTMDQARDVTANFALKMYALSVSKSGLGSGAVTSSPAGIDCGQSCSTRFNSGTSVTLTAAAANDSTFTGWSGACTGTGACTVTMDQARDVTATFALKTFALTVTKSGAGSGVVTSSPAGIDCGQSCSASFSSGTSVTLTAAAANDSTFTGWSGACTGTGACTVTMNEAKSVTATFALKAVPAVVSGKVIDGYIDGARVFVDMNWSMAYEEGEPVTTSDETGSYSFSSEDLANFACYRDLTGPRPIIAEVPVGAIDRSGGTVTKPFNLVFLPPQWLGLNVTVSVANLTPFTSIFSAAISNAGGGSSGETIPVAGGCGAAANDIAERVREQMRFLAEAVVEAGYAPEKLFEDYVATGDFKAQRKGELLVNYLTKSLEVSQILVEAIREEVGVSERIVATTGFSPSSIKSVLSDGEISSLPFDFRTSAQQISVPGGGSGSLNLDVKGILLRPDGSAISAACSEADVENCPALPLTTADEIFKAATEVYKAVRFGDGRGLNFAKGMKDGLVDCENRIRFDYEPIYLPQLDPSTLSELSLAQLEFIYKMPIENGFERFGCQSGDVGLTITKAVAYPPTPDGHYYSLFRFGGQPSEDRISELLPYWSAFARGDFIKTPFNREVAINELSALPSTPNDLEQVIDALGNSGWYFQTGSKQFDALLVRGSGINVCTVNRYNSNEQISRTEGAGAVGACYSDLGVFNSNVRLAVSRTGGGAGAISSSPSGVNCGDVCEALVAAGTTVTLTATPDESSTFEGWSGACLGTARQCTIKMAHAASVSARFEIKARPVASVDAASVSFANQAIDTASAAKKIILSNRGGLALALSDISLKGLYRELFALSDNCSETLSPGASCELSIVFSPSSLGSKTAEIHIEHSADNSPIVIPVSGIGVPAVVVTPASLSFEDRAVQTTSAEKSVTLVNQSPLLLGAPTVRIRGAASSDFSFTSNCDAGLPVDSQCRIDVRFQPSAVGVREAKLEFEFSGSDISAVSGPVVIAGRSASALTSADISNSETQRFRSENGHIYEIVQSNVGLDWNSARLAARTRSIGGVQGHLVTITTPEELAFIKSNFTSSSKVGAHYWIGASDSAAEGRWVWTEGLEVGQSAYPGVTGMWRANEPNNLNNEDCAEYFAAWQDVNDHRCTDRAVEAEGGFGYLVEYSVPPSVTFQNPYDVAVDQAGTVYVANYRGHRVHKVANGVTSIVAGTGEVGSTGDGEAATAAALNHPVAVAVDTTGNVYIAEEVGARIRRVSSNGVISTLVEGLGRPMGLAIDPSANFLYVSEFNAGLIVKVNLSDGTRSALVTGLVQPQGLSTDGRGNLYVTEYGRGRVLRFAPDGRLLNVIAGTGTNDVATGDGGRATTATLNEPRDVEVDQHGNVFIGDSTGIRRVDRNGNISMLVARERATGFAIDSGTLIYGGVEDVRKLALTYAGTTLVISDGVPVTGIGEESNSTLSVQKTGTGSGAVTSSPAGIDCGQACSASFSSGTSVTLTAAAANNSSFTGWSGACTGTDACTVMMDQARDVTANFALKTYALSVSKSGTGSGAVTSSPAGIDCGQSCSASFNSGTTVTLTAAAANDSTFTGWGGACTGTAICTVSMSEAKSVTATFSLVAQAARSLTIAKSGTGTGTVTSAPAGINCGQSCSASFSSGTSVTLTPAAANDSTFTGWSGACTGTGVCTVSMSEARSVAARFDIKGAIAQLDRTQVVFDSQPLQSESLPQTVVISNVGSSVLQISQLSLSGENSSDFAIVSSCSEIVPGATCRVQLVFKPSDEGNRVASLRLVSNSTSPVVDASLSGVGSVVSLVVSPANLEFYKAAVGKPETKTIRITNKGGTAVKGVTVSLGDADPKIWSVTSNCGAWLYSSYYCDATITFSPTSTVDLFVPAGLRIESASGVTGQTVIHTYVGDGSSDSGAAFSGDGKHVSEGSRVNAPKGLEIDAAGNLLIADSGNVRIRRVSPDGVITTYAGTGGVGGVCNGGAATLCNLPGLEDIRSDKAGNIYFSSGANVHVITANGIISPINFQNNLGEVKFKLATGLAIDGENPFAGMGHIFVVDREKHQIWKSSVGGLASVWVNPGATAGFGGEGVETGGLSSQTNFPQYADLDSRGNLYFADRKNNRIRSVTATGNEGAYVLKTVARFLAEPHDIELASDSRALVSNWRSGFQDHKVSLVNFNGTTDGSVADLIGSGLTGYVSGFGIGDGGSPVSSRLYGPTGIATDKFGNIYIAEFLGHRVRRVQTVDNRAQKIGVNFYAEFPKPVAALTVTKSGTGTGTVTSAPAGIDCGQSCSASFSSGTSVMLTAAAANDSTFTGWSGACTGTGACTVSITEAKSVTATFTLKTFALTVTKSGTGSGTVSSTPAGINCGQSCSASFSSGTSVTLTAAAANDSTFTGWSGACTGTGACTVTMDQARGVTAIFVSGFSASDLSLSLNVLGYAESSVSGAISVLGSGGSSASFAIESQGQHGTATINSTTGLVTYTVAGSPTVTATTDQVIVSVTAGAASTTARVNVALRHDPLFAYQWHLRNVGQSTFADTAPTAGVDINVAPAWAAGYSGNGVKVAVVDSGLEIAHEDLAGNVDVGRSIDFRSDGNDPTDSAPLAAGHGDHGTKVAGIIAAQAFNGKGGRGIAHRSRLRGYNLLKGDPVLAFSRSFGQDARSSDTDIFNGSFGTITSNFLPGASPSKTSILNATTALRGGKGSVVIFSAGNNFENNGSQYSPNTCGNSTTRIPVSCSSPATDDYKQSVVPIIVGALAADGKKASYSNASSSIWMSAPAGESGYQSSVVGPSGSATAYKPAIVTANTTECSNYALSRNLLDRAGQNPLATRCQYTASMNGTSSAAPMVAGVAALMLEANPNLGYRDVAHILAKTAKKVDSSFSGVSAVLAGASRNLEPGWIVNAAGYNFSNRYGFGAVDAGAAVSMAKSYTDFLPAQQLVLATPFLAGGDLNISANGKFVNFSINSSLTKVEKVFVKVNLFMRGSGAYGVSCNQIEVTSPSGTRSVLLNAANGFQNSWLFDVMFSSNAFYGESPNGTWRMTVYDWCSDAFLTPTQFSSTRSQEFALTGH